MKKKNDIKYINKSLVIKDLVAYIDMDDEVKSKNLIKQYNVDINEIYNQVINKDLLKKYFNRTKYTELYKKNLKKDISYFKYSAIEFMIPTISSLLLIPLSYYVYVEKNDINFHLFCTLVFVSMFSSTIFFMSLKNKFLNFKRKKTDLQHLIDSE